MRPLKLTIEGIKSISERQTINFEKLSANGIFGIFGKTGSGKSTILDSIILALYGEVVGKIDNSEFVNSSCNSARVELVFASGGKGEKHVYRIFRSYKFDKAREKLKQPEAFLWEVTDLGEIPIAEGTKQVNQSIKEDIIGLEKDDFLKCIALPQGEFSAFVKMTRGDRLKVIGKLFNLQKYGKQLYDKVKSKDDELYLEQSNYNAKLEMLNDFTPENFEKTVAEFESVKKQRDKIKAEDDLNKENLQIAKTAKECMVQRNGKQDELNKKLAYKSVIEGYKGEILELDSALKVKDIIKAVEQDGKRLEIEKQKLERLSLREGQLKASFEQSALKNEETAALNEKKQGFIQKLAMVESNENLKHEIQKRQNELVGFEEKSKRLEEQLKKNGSEITNKTNELVLVCENLEKTNLNVQLEKLSSCVEREGIVLLAREQIAFINELVTALKIEIKNFSESAVNALIEAHIQKLNGYLDSFNASEDVKSLAKGLIEILDRQNLLTAKKSKLESEIKAVREISVRLTEERNELLQRIADCKADINAFKEKEKSLFGGLSYDEALEAVKQAIKRVEAKITAIGEEYKDALEKYNQAKIDAVAVRGGVAEIENSLAANRDILENRLLELKLEKGEVWRILQSEEQTEIKRNYVKSFEKEVVLLENSLGELNVKIKEIPQEYFNFDFYVEKCVKSGDELEEINKKYGEIKTRYEMRLKNKEDWCIIYDNLKLINKKRELYGKLIELFKLDRFMEYIAEEYLNEIASIASRRVLELTNGRYGLLYDKNFFVTDNLKGGARRPVASLSGGETFLVSLSLALALSFRISSKAMRPIDFFFLDEGFGTLDEELVNTVTESLEKLHRSQLTVGLITHVAELKNRIQSKLYVSGATATTGTTFSESF